MTSSEPVIRVEEVSKLYRLGSGYGWGATTLRESLSSLRWMRRKPPATKRSVWAVKDVSFEVRQGELVGLMGRNGAGKSTILKILARITRPTSGSAEIRGRVGSLLDVGTGFHPQLTGRENVYLAGAILGMHKSEIRARFDQIVDFAEIGEFLDTPTKRYSSGMQVRLAFAVAAHLEPEVLIVDEVLAVGDLAFQKKCLDKMGEVTGEGRTVLFVSHNMSLIQSLCHRGILFEHGAIVVDAEIDDAVSTYLGALETIGMSDLLNRRDRYGWGRVRVTGLELSSDIGNGRLVTGRPAKFVVHLSQLVAGLSCAITVLNHLGQPLVTFDSALASSEDYDDPEAGTTYECCIDELLLVPGRYRVDLVVQGLQHVQDHVEAAAYFDVEPGPVRGRPLDWKSSGDIVMPSRWRRPARTRNRT